MSESVNSPFLIISAQEAVVYGDWTLANYAQISSNVSVALKSAPPITRCDLTALGDLDTAGASLLVELMGSDLRSEENTSELQSLMRMSYAVFCLIKHRNT